MRKFGLNVTKAVMRQTQFAICNFQFSICNPLRPKATLNSPPTIHLSHCFKVLFSVMILLSGLAAAAPATELRPDELPRLINDAKGRFAPVTERRLAEARMALQAAVDTLNRRLDREGANGQAWREYLGVDVIQQETAKAGAADAARLWTVRKRFVGGHAGLEKDVFTDVRTTLTTFAQAVEDLANANLRNDFDTHLAGLAESVESYLAGQGEESWEQIARHLGWLEQHDQVASLVAAVRGCLSRANLAVHVSEKVIDAYIGASIDETGPVQDVILGTRISGTGRTIGKVTASLVPDDVCGRVQVDMIATNHAQTVGSKGSVRIYQNNRTEFHAWKQVLVGQGTLDSLPARSTASTSAQLTGMATDFRSRLLDSVARRAACRQMQKQKQQANRIAESHQCRRLNRQLDDEVAAQLAETNAELGERFFYPLTRYDAFPRRFDSRTDEDQLAIVLEEAGRQQLGADVDPPPFVQGTDLAFQLHRSALENYAAEVLAGKTLTAEEISEAFRKLSGDTRQDDESESPDNITIVLAAVKPISLRFDAGVITLTIRGRRFISGRTAYPAMNVSLRYRLEQVGSGLRATLLTDFTDDQHEIVPPRLANGGPGRLNGREVTLRGMLAQRLARDLRKEFSYDGITLDGKLSVLGKLSVVQLVADDGWLTFACRQPDTPGQIDDGSRAAKIAN